MPSQGKVEAVLAIGGYNLVQNLALPVGAYVPANLAATAGLIALARRFGCSWEELGLRPSHLVRGFRTGLIGVGAALTVAVMATGHRRVRPYLLDQRAADQRRRDVVYRVLVRLPLGTALFEEVAFRGVIEAIWRRAGSDPRDAATVAAIGFALWHLIPGTQALDGNPLDQHVNSALTRAGVVTLGALLTGLASLGFSRMRARSGSLMAPWLTHAAVNSAMYLTGVAAWRRATS